MGNEDRARLIEAVLAPGRVDTQRALALAEGAVISTRSWGAIEKSWASASGPKRTPCTRRAERHSILPASRANFGIPEKTKEEIGRTLRASLQALILVGEYDRAFEAADRAREIFTRLDEPRRLARLENNVGKFHHRQDRFEEAFACYERATSSFFPTAIRKSW